MADMNPETGAVAVGDRPCDPLADLAVFRSAPDLPPALIPRRSHAYGTLEDGTVLVLRQHSAGIGEAFDETRSGLDHLSFTFASRADLDRLAERLVAAGTTWTPVQTTEYAHILNFRDPDNIALEGTAALR